MLITVIIIFIIILLLAIYKQEYNINKLKDVVNHNALECYKQGIKNLQEIDNEDSER